MIKQIVKYPNPTLRLKSTIANCPSKVIQDLKDTMKSSKGLGLSAIQIGHPYRAFVTENEVYIDPKIISFSGSETQPEGCLSLPGVTVWVTRPTSIEVTYKNEKYQEIKKTITGLECRVFQHEMDHCNGVLIDQYQ